MDMFNVYLPIAQMEFNVLLLMAIGFCVGVLGGFFGVGGAWIVTPALNIFGFPMPLAIGTDFAHIFGKSIVATRKHGKMGNVDWKLGITTMVGTVPGVWIGAQLIMYLDKLGKQSGQDIVGSSVRWTYIIMLLGLGIFMSYDYFVLRKKKEAKKLQPGAVHEKSLIDKIRAWKFLAISYPKSNIESISILIVFAVFFFCGFISGFLGVGGGFIRMPSLVYLIGVPTALAVGTDLFIVMLDGAYGCFLYSFYGRTELLAAVFMLFGASIGAQIGVTAVKYIRGYGIRLLFAIMVFFAGISVVLKQMDSIMNSPGLKTASGWVIMGSASVMCLIIIIRLIVSARKEIQQKKAGL
ncbi:MAG: sulfite exporter TauE/SafE family protein [Bacteroidetes bacterium]|nr:MAG: sulfite exporter TauE/SafE family protein [Bacteroidota bacterium]